MDWREGLFWFAIALNFAGAGIQTFLTMRTLKARKKIIAALKSPVYECVRLGHDFEFDKVTLDDQQPPNFRLTHMVKWTCKRPGCGFEQHATLRENIIIPGAERIVLEWDD